MFFEFASHLISLDIAWLISLIMSNLHWLFFLYALMYFFMEGKRVWWGFLVVVFVCWIWSDWEIVSGGFLFVGGFLSLYYITKLAVLSFAENSPGLKKRLLWVSEIQFIVALLAFNVWILLYGG